MRWIVLFEDTPGMLPHRAAHKEAHVAYISAHSDQILIGGGLQAMPGAPFEGGLWVVEAETQTEVVGLVLGDPYFNPDHRRFRIYHWNRILEAPVTL